jgi:hypothetical protein
MATDRFLSHTELALGYYTAATWAFCMRMRTDAGKAKTSSMLAKRKNILVN